jgi:hypothetical protein
MGRISKKEAAELRRGGDLPSCGAGELLSNTRRAAAPAPVLPPGPDWQAAARAFVGSCQAALWSEAGGRALAWLRGRGLADETIRAAGLGYNPAPRDPARWAWSTWGEKRVKLYRGIVIPWEVAGDLWRVNVRRPAGDPKYYSPAGWANGLYNAGELTRDRPALLVEGELDALTVGQVAGDLITPVALGSTSGARRPRWIVPLAACPLVLVALDADLDPNKGARAAAWWVDVLPNAKRWRPWWGDANAMHQEGADLRAWISAGLPVANNSGPAHQVGTPAIVSRPSTPAAEPLDLEALGAGLAKLGAVAIVTPAALPTPDPRDGAAGDLQDGAELAAALPCSLEAWPDLAARWGGLPGVRLAWPEGAPGLVAEPAPDANLV